MPLCYEQLSRMEREIIAINIRNGSICPADCQDIGALSINDQPRAAAQQIAENLPRTGRSQGGFKTEEARPTNMPVGLSEAADTG